MRQIKFRAWMQRMDGTGYMVDGDDVIRDLFEYLEDAVVMQFTGLLDKNGAEIYEGDIVTLTGTGDDPCVITSKITFGSIGACYHDGRNINRLDMFCGQFKDSRIGTLVEIIGNIHESPELLEA